MSSPAQVPPETALGPVSRILLAESAQTTGRVALVDVEPALDAAAGDRWQLSTYRDRLDGGPSRDTLAEAVAGADLVLLALPGSLGALDEYAHVIASHAAPGVRLVAAGRIKHMTRGQNEVLARHFGAVTASRGLGKCRALHASGPRPGNRTWPRTATDPVTGLVLAAHGPTFAGTRLDAGTRLLLSTTERWPAGHAVDVGCGNGVLTATLARHGRTVTGIDVSRSAVASTNATLHANGLAATVRLADGLTGTPTSSTDLVVTNPPFHVGAAKDSTAAMRIIREAARVLRPGGELWCVHNSHLPYRQVARTSFDEVEVAAQNRHFTVMRARLR